MSTISNIIVRSNLGADFALDTTNKLVHVNIDGTTIKRDTVTGVLTAISGPSLDEGDLLTPGSDGLPYLDIAAIHAAETLVSLTGSKSTGAPILTFTNQAGTVSTIDLASLVTDLNVDGGSFDPLTTVLTLTQVEGPAITVNLGDLAKSSTANTTSATISGDGSAASPLSVAVKVSASAGNAVSTNVDGLFVPAGGGLTTDNTNHTVVTTIASGVLSADVVVDNTVAGNMLVSTPASGVSVQPLKTTNAADGSMNIAVSGNATTGQTVTGSVNLSATAGNLAVKKNDGVYVAPIALVDGNGIHLAGSVVSGVETITANVVIDTATSDTNFASVSSAGLNVAATTVFDIELQDLFNTHIAWARVGTGSTSPN